MSRSAALTGPESQVLEQILQEAAGEDLTGLSDADIRALAHRLWGWASKVPAGEQAVRVDTQVDGAKGPLGRSVLEAAGPDMPFLVDSLLNECAAQGHGVKTLFHPVVTLADGRMISVIQIHTSLLTPEEGRKLEDGARTTPADANPPVSAPSPMQPRLPPDTKSLRVLSHPHPHPRD